MQKEKKDTFWAIAENWIEYFLLYSIGIGLFGFIMEEVWFGGSAMGLPEILLRMTGLGILAGLGVSIFIWGFSVGIDNLLNYLNDNKSTS